MTKVFVPEDFAVVIKQHINLCSDICKIAENDPVKFRKVRDDMLAVRETYFETVAREATEKAEQKAYEKEVNIVLKMINKNCDDEFIQNVTDFSLEEIAKIREEHSNQ